MQWIQFSPFANKYIGISDYLSPWVTAPEPNVLRTSIIPNVVSNVRHWAFATQGGNAESRYRRRAIVSGGGVQIFENNDSFWNFPTGTTILFDWYTGSASNTLIYESAYLRQGFQQ